MTAFWYQQRTLLWFCLAVITSAHAQPFDSGQKIINGTAPLPYTDGNGLLTKPPAFTQQQMNGFMAQGKIACDGQCLTPYGTILGVADGAKARSNCVSECIEPEYSFLNLRTNDITIHQTDPQKADLSYIGLAYQCVEYARKWWMINKGITFGSIDSAYETIYLTEGINIHTKQPFPLARSINGTAKRPPKRGDLIVYYPDRTTPNWRHGHMAVVVDVDINNGTVSLAEQNYDNQTWKTNQHFSRKIRLFTVGRTYQLIDVPPSSSNNPQGGLIAGWIYPLADQ